MSHSDWEFSMTTRNKSSSWYRVHEIQNVTQIFPSKT